MFTQLLESGGHRRRSIGGAIPSVVLHSALILGAIQATAHAALNIAVPAPQIDTLVFSPDVAPTVHPVTRHKSGTLAATPSLHFASLVTDIPPLSLGVASIAPAPPLVRAGEFAHGVTPAFSAGPDFGEPPGSVLNSGQVDRAAEAVPGTAAPDYPEILRTNGVQGVVVAQFVVDTAGHVEVGSFRAVAPANDQFVAAVQTSLMRALFRPAMLHGIPVRQLVQQSFTFVLR